VDRLDFLGRSLSAIGYIDGEIRTEQGAQSTVDAVGMVYDLRGVVALSVGTLGNEQHVLRAKLDAEPTALAPFVDDVDETIRYLDTIPIQRLSPKAHDPTSILHHISIWLQASRATRSAISLG
jgi:hypothetical protein